MSSLWKKAWLCLWKIGELYICWEQRQITNRGIVHTIKPLILTCFLPPFSSLLYQDKDSDRRSIFLLPATADGSRRGAARNGHVLHRHAPANRAKRVDTADQYGDGDTQNWGRLAVDAYNRILWYVAIRKQGHEAAVLVRIADRASHQFHSYQEDDIEWHLQLHHNALSVLSDGAKWMAGLFMRVSDTSYMQEAQGVRQREYFFLTYSLHYTILEFHSP